MHFYGFSVSPPLNGRSFHDSTKTHYTTTLTLICGSFVLINPSWKLVFLVATCCWMTLSWLLLSLLLLSVGAVVDDLHCSICPRIVDGGTEHSGGLAAPFGHSLLDVSSAQFGFFSVVVVLLRDDNSLILSIDIFDDTEHSWSCLIRALSMRERVKIEKKRRYWLIVPLINNWYSLFVPGARAHMGCKIPWCGAVYPDIWHGDARYPSICYTV